MALVNALLVRWAGGWTWVEDGGSVGLYGRREGYLQAGTAGSIEEAGRVGAAVLAAQAEPRTATAMTLEPAGGDAPYDDFGVADWLWAPGMDGVPASRRVLALTVRADDEGDPVWTPEVEALVEDGDAKRQRWLKRLANGALGGTVESAAPWRPAPVVPDTVRRSETAVFGATAPSADESPPWPWRRAGTVHTVELRATVAGSSVTTVEYRHNGDTFATLSLGAGETSKSAKVTRPVGAGDRATVAATAVGSGVSGVSALVHKS